MDVDGVLTDGTFWWGINGEEFKRFCCADATGISVALNEGVKIALISGESSPAGMALVQRFADKLKITDVTRMHDKRPRFGTSQQRINFRCQRYVSLAMTLSTFLP